MPSWPPSRPVPCPARPRCGRWRSLRSWSRPGGGGAVLHWAPAVALVALAGAAAIVAVRGWLRSALAGVLVVAGLALAIGGGFVAGTGRGNAWSLLCALGGVLVAHAGLKALLRGGSWPGLGSRYERATEPVEYGERSGPSRSD